MKYVCERCGVTTPDTNAMPDKCPTCGAEQEKLSLVQGEVTPVIQEAPKEPEVPSTFGVVASPADIKSIVKLISIPSGGNVPHKEFQKVVMQLFADKMVAYHVGPSESILTILELENGFFDETFGTGDIVIDSAKTLKKLSILSTYDQVSIQVDNDNKVILHRAGSEAIFSDNLEDASHVRTSRDKMPLPFDYDAYAPKVDAKSNKSEFEWYAVAEASTFKTLFEFSSDAEIDYYPFTLTKDSFKTGVGDMENPSMEGAFELNIPVAENSILPVNDIKVEVGPIFMNVMKNLVGEVKVYFAGDELPLWIVSDIIRPVVEDGKTVDKVFGKIGYVIPPRSV